MALDTLSYARRLKQAGMPEAQAEAIAEATRDFVLEDLATNANLVRVEEGLKAEIGRIEQKLTAEIGRIEQKLTAEIGRIEQKLTAEIGRVEQRLTTEVASLRAEMEALSLRLTVRMGLMFAAGLSIMTALIGLMIRLR
jgi:ethanolamine ammonia-lyase large subunit